MNQMPYPYFPMLEQPPFQPNLLEEIRKLNTEVKNLKERVSLLEKKEEKNNTNDFLEKDDNYYII